MSAKITFNPSDDEVLFAGGGCLGFFMTFLFVYLMVVGGISWFLTHDTKDASFWMTCWAWMRYISLFSNGPDSKVPLKFVQIVMGVGFWLFVFFANQVLYQVVVKRITRTMTID